MVVLPPVGTVTKTNKIKAKPHASIKIMNYFYFVGMNEQTADHFDFFGLVRCAAFNTKTCLPTSL
jgi:hypothetical protein